MFPECSSAGETFDLHGKFSLAVEQMHCGKLVSAAGLFAECYLYASQPELRATAPISEDPLTLKVGL
jgi:hypothetical protein